MEAERIVIAAVLIGSVPFRAVGLSSEQFSGPNREIWSAMTALAERGAEPDEPTVIDELAARKAKVDPAYVGTLTTGVPRNLRVEQWVSLIREAAGKRALRRLLERCLKALEADMSLSEAQGKLLGRLMTIADPGASCGLAWGPELAKSALVELDRRISHPVPGISTGLRTLDGWSGGVQGYWVIGARTSVGKSSLCVQIAWQAVQAGVRTLYFSTEMSKAALALRGVCSDQRLKCSGEGWRDYVPEIRKQVALAAKLPIGVMDHGNMALSQIVAACQRTRADGGLGLVIVDHIQHLVGGDGQRSESENIALTVISRGLQQLAKQLECPVIVASQLSRDSDKEKRRPRLSDLRGSGSLEQDADVVLLLWRDSEDLKNHGEHDAELILAKQRSGVCGTIQATYQPSFTRFSERY